MGWKPEDVALLKRSKKDIKNVDHMIINHDIATVREFMICKVKVWKGYFCPPPPPPPLYKGEAGNYGRVIAMPLKYWLMSRSH